MYKRQTLDITPINDAPSFAAQNPPAVNEDPEGVTVSNWSTFNPGPGESNQLVLAYQVANVSNPGLFSILPTIDALGNLVYDPRKDASGQSNFDVRVLDSGNSDNGGSNASGFQTFTITVNPVNDPPQLIASNPPPTITDSGSQLVNQWAAFNAGAPDESTQQVTIDVTSVENESLFAVAPTVDAQGNLRYTPASGTSGTTAFSVRASDNGGTANGGSNVSEEQTFVIEIRADALFLDSFE